MDDGETPSVEKARQFGNANENARNDCGRERTKENTISTNAETRATKKRGGQKVNGVRLNDYLNGGNCKYREYITPGMDCRLFRMTDHWVFVKYVPA